MAAFDHDSITRRRASTARERRRLPFGQTLRITYGTAGGPTPPAAPPSQQHTGSAVPVWARRPGAAAILGTTDHTDLFDVLTP